MSTIIRHRLHLLERAVAVALLCLICFGCDDDPLNLGIREGVYTGVFTIRESDGTEQSGGVTFTFTAHTYSCVPDERYLPPSGAGTYRTYNNTLVLTDMVAIHTAEFDLTQILGGEFSFSFDGRTLTLGQNDKKYNRVRTIVLTFQHR